MPNYPNQEDEKEARWLWEDQQRQEEEHERRQDINGTPPEMLLEEGEREYWEKEFFGEDE